MSDIKDRVAAGLRNMKNTPDAFLFCDGIEDWTWDEENIFGTPVFHAEAIEDIRWQSSLKDVLFIPIWKEEGSHISDRNDFIDGYSAEYPLRVEEVKKNDEEFVEDDIPF